MSDAENMVGYARPTSLEELGRRLSAVLDLLGTRRKASEIAGRSTDMLSKYEKGSVEPPFLALSRLCLATNTRMEWLATGNGEMRSATIQTAPHKGSHPARQPAASMEMGLLTTAVRMVSDVLEQHGARDQVSSDQFADLVQVTFRDLERGAAEDATLDALNRILSIARKPHND